MEPSSGEPSTDQAPGFQAQIGMLDDLKRKRSFDEALQVVSSLRDQPLSSEEEQQVSLYEAEILVLTGERERAEEIYAELHKVNPTHPRVLSGRAVIAANRNEWESAEKLFQEALQSNRDYDVALAGLGLCASVRGEHEKAWEWYMEAVQRNPENVRALLGVIELGYPLHRLEDVERALEQYLEMHPGDMQFLYAYAGCLFARGKHDQALSEVQKILIFEPENERAKELRDLIVEGDVSPAGISQAS